MSKGWRLVTRQSGHKGRWEHTSTSRYKSKTDANKRAENLRKELRKDKRDRKKRGKKFYYRVSVLPP